jgi:hypothetical protein
MGLIRDANANAGTAARRAARLLPVIGVIGVLPLAGCTALGSASAAASSAPSAAPATPPAATATAKAAPRRTSTPGTRRTPRARSAEAACDARGFASGDIYVRIITPGLAPVAQELGGEWVWDVATGKCLTSVQMTIATAPQTAGNCTQVGYVADNPGYDVNAATAPPLKDVADESGPAC